MSHLLYLVWLNTWLPVMSPNYGYKCGYKLGEELFEVQICEGTHRDEWFHEVR